MSAVRIAVPIALALAASGGPCDAAKRRFFAATGFAKGADAVRAAGDAARDMMSRFRAAGMRPLAVLFLERVESRRELGAAAGAKVKEVAGGVPTYGHGGCGRYGIPWADVRDDEPSVLVLGLAGEGLEVTAAGVGGGIKYDYSKRPEDRERVKALREACRSRGAELGRRLPPFRKPGLAILLGALHNNWHVTFAEGVRESLGPDAPLIGGVGKWNDYVYLDGRDLADVAGRKTPVGQMLVGVQGDIAVSLAGRACKNTWRRGTALADGDAVAGKVLAGLGGRRPALLLAFSCVTRLRNCKIMDPSVEHARVSGVVGEGVPAFGAYCGGELGFDMDGRFSAGGDRLMMAAIAAR
jgi:hypothetical protein